MLGGFRNFIAQCVHVNHSLTKTWHFIGMLQVWKIEVPIAPEAKGKTRGWALAHTADEARKIAGVKNAEVTRKPDHLWVARERLVWESSP